MSELLIAGGELVDRAGYGGYALLVGAVFIALLTSFPISPLCLVGGLAVGYAALPVILAGATAGSAVAALLSRYLLRARFAAALTTRPTLKAVVQAIEEGGWWVIFLLRFSSPVPGTLLSYGVGLTRVGLWTFCSANTAAMLIPVSLLVAIGAAGRAALEGSAISKIQAALLGVGLLSSVAAATTVTKRARLHLQRAARSEAAEEPQSRLEGG